MARLAIHEAMRSEADDATTDSDDEERGEAAA
jgi:hypothetical protein